jgi:long-chain acyl-CoA synthetase
MSAVTAAIPAHAQNSPDRPALVFEQDRMAWRDLARALDRIAGHIAVRVPEGGGVALHLPNSPALALLVLGTAHAGREAQVLDPDWPLETTRAVLADLAPAVTITADRRLADSGVLVLDNPLAPFAAIAEVLGAPRQTEARPQPAGHVPFYVGFTSGSTGRPKGYRRHHRSWTESFRAGAAEFGIGPDDVVLAPGALTHSLFLYAMVDGLHAGATVVLCRRFRPTSIVRLTREHRATVLYGVPTHLRLVLEAAQAAGMPRLEHVRWVLSSGAKWFADAMPDLRRLFPAARFAEFYGASELSFVTVARDDEPVPDGSVGRAFAGVTISVRDRRGRRLPPGRIGLVFVDSPLVFSGYALGGEEDVFRVGRAISVGDLGHLDADGFLHLAGRSKRMIVSAGKNLYPEEIERVLEQHATIAAAAVFGMPDAKRGERLVALVSVQPEARLSRATLIAYARGRLPLYKVPRAYGVVADWPRTRSGKSDFPALHRLWCQGAFERLA